MNNRIIIWFAILFVLFCFFYSVSSILFPFIFGIFLAYFFDPIANLLCKKGFSRTASAATVVILFSIVLILAILLLVPIVIEQSQNFLKLIPDIINSLRSEVIPRIQEQFPTIASEIAEHATEKVETSASTLDLKQLITVTGKNFIDSGSLLFNVLSIISITPIVSFYILRDWSDFKNEFNRILPRKHEADIRQVISKIDQKISAFLRGQLNICLILGTYYALTLSILGLHLGLLIGFVAGLLCFIPYIGTIAGIMMGFMLGYFQYGPDLLYLSFILAIFGIGQIVEGNFLTPKIVGDKLGIHPAFLIFGMLSGGALLGMTGVILAVPITAILSVLLEYALSKYFNSSLYQQAQ